MHTDSTLLGAIFITVATAHMQLHTPPPFNASNNPHRTTPADPYLQFPYDCCGPHDRWIFPCRGYLSLLGTDQGAPTATWAAGSNQSWSIQGTGNHYGGSCQVGFLDDNSTHEDAGEKLFRVATSYEGNCPHRNAGDGPDGQHFEFVVPKDLKPGVRVFAWIWYNREQEFNMNCAAVNITASSAAVDAGGNKADKGNESAESSAASMMFGHQDSITTSFTTISKTLTTFTTTTVTPSRKQPGIGAGPNQSQATTAAPSSSKDWARFGEGHHSVSSNSTTTIITTIYPSSSQAITTTLSGLSELASQGTYTAVSGSSAAPPSSLEDNGGPQTSSSAEETTTIYLTITVAPSGVIPASAPSLTDVASQIASTALPGTASTSSRSLTNLGDASASESLSLFSSISGILYTSTTTTVMKIVTTTVGAPSSSSTPPPVFGPAAANMTQKNVKTFRTANNCTCTCPDADPPNIEDCVCFCYQPLSREQRLNLTSPVASRLGLSIFNPSKVPGKNVARPDDLVMHPCGLDKARRQDQTSTTSGASPSFVPFYARPLMLIANDGNGCITPKTTAELKYPQPGPDVVEGDQEYPLRLPNGTCSSPGDQKYHGEDGNDGHV